MEDILFAGGYSARRQVAGSPIKFADTQPALARRAPLLGEHTNAVLEAAGVTPEQVAVWRERGAIR